MPRHIHFGQDTHPQPGAVFHQIRQFLLHIELSGLPSLPEGGGVCQFGVVLYLHPPSRIVRKVQMKHVYFIMRQAAGQFLDEVHRGEVSPHIQHHPPHTERRRVFNGATGYSVTFLFLYDKLPQRLQAIENP